MISRIFACLACVLLSFPEASLAVDYLGRLDDAIGRWKSDLPAISASAKAAAVRIVQGGNLYVGGTQKSLIGEACGRSGGLSLVQALRPETVLAKDDVVVLAATDSKQLEEIKTIVARAKEVGALVVLFSDSVRIDDPRIVCLPTKPSGVDVLGTPSVESVSNVAGLWTWTGEFVAHCIRLGKMPCLFESYGMPGGRARDEFFKGLRFHERNVGETENLDIGRQYLQILSRTVASLKEYNGESFQRAAVLLQEARQNRQRAVILAVAHMFPNELASNAHPDWLGVAPADFRGDDQSLVIFLGYQAFPWEVPFLAGPGRKPAIITSSRAPGPDWPEDALHVYLRPFWEVQDAVVTIPGYDVKILPQSGIIQSAILWKLIESLGRIP